MLQLIQRESREEQYERRRLSGCSQENISVGLKQYGDGNQIVDGLKNGEIDVSYIGADEKTVRGQQWDAVWLTVGFVAIGAENGTVKQLYETRQKQFLKAGTSHPPCPWRTMRCLML